MLASRVKQGLGRFGHDFNLGIVVKAHSKAIERLLELSEAVHLKTVLVECHTALLAHLRGVRMLVGRTHLQENTDSITYRIGLTSVNGFSTINDGAI